MSEHHLPEELSRWPTSPFAILGVEIADDLRVVRLAYTRLIRQFKPEAFPEHFRRLREAYEAVRGLTGGQHRAIDLEVLVERQNRTDGGEQQTTDSSTFRTERGRGLAESIHDAWKLAEEDRMGEAYNLLQSLSKRFGLRQDLSLAQYWILKIDPAIDTARSRLDFLAEALTFETLAGTPTELLRRELYGNPAEVMHKRFHDYWQTDNQWALCQRMELRWICAFRLGVGRIIINDIESRRTKLCSRENLWTQLLLTAVNQLAWFSVWFNAVDANEAFSKYSAELEKTQQLDSTIEHELVRFDLLQKLRPAWARLALIPDRNQSFATIVHRIWSDPEDESIYRLRIELLKSLSANVQESLARLDQVAKRDSILVFQLWNALGKSGYTRNVFRHQMEYDDELARERILNCLQTLEWSSWQEFRVRLLDICISEAVSPTSVAVFANQLPNDSTVPKDTQSRIESDFPLRCVYAAWSAFWSGT